MRIEKISQFVRKYISVKRKPKYMNLEQVNFENLVHKKEQAKEVFGCPGSGKVQQIIRDSGSGKEHHALDSLKLCTCGEPPSLSFDEDLLIFDAEQNLATAVCPACGRHTKHKKVDHVIDDWNNDIVEPEDAVSV